MPKVYVRLVLLPLTLFAAALVLMRSQHYDDHDLRQLLRTDGCPAPCFMGIRPGVTTVEEAVNLLGESGWVDQIERNETTISWSWNGQQPPFIDVLQRPHMNFSKGQPDTETISEIIIPTQTPIGSIMLMMSNPETFMVLRDSENHGMISEVTYVSLRYSDLLVEGNTFCPSQVHDVLHRKAVVTFYNYRDATFYLGERLWDNKHFILALQDPLNCH